MSSSRADRLEAHKRTLGATTLFDHALAVLGPGLSGQRSWIYPVGVRFGEPSGGGDPP